MQHHAKQELVYFISYELMGLKSGIAFAFPFAFSF